MPTNRQKTNNPILEESRARYNLTRKRLNNRISIECQLTWCTAKCRRQFPIENTFFTHAETEIQQINTDLLLQNNCLTQLFYNDLRNRVEYCRV